MLCFSIKVVNAHLVPWQMCIVLLLEYVVKSFCLVHWIVIYIFNLHWLHHLWWFLLSFWMTFFGVGLHFVILFVHHLLFQGHFCCHLIYFHCDLFCWHVPKPLLTRAYIGNFLVKIDMFEFHNLVHDLNKWR